MAAVQALLAVQDLGAAPLARPAAFSAACLGPRFAYTALRQLRRSRAGRGVRGCVTKNLDYSGAMEFTVVAQFINQGPGTCED